MLLGTSRQHILVSMFDVVGRQARIIVCQPRFERLTLIVTSGKGSGLTRNASGTCSCWVSAPPACLQSKEHRNSDLEVFVAEFDEQAGVGRAIRPSSMRAIAPCLAC